MKLWPTIILASWSCPTSDSRSLLLQLFKWLHLWIVDCRWANFCAGNLSSRFTVLSSIPNKNEASSRSFSFVDFQGTFFLQWGTPCCNQVIKEMLQIRNAVLFAIHWKASATELKFSVRSGAQRVAQCQCTISCHTQKMPVLGIYQDIAEGIFSVNLC